MDISLNKYISDSGFCSRREADRYIEECRVTINDKDASKGNRVKEGDVVKIDGEPIRKKKQTVSNNNLPNFKKRWINLKS